MSLTKFIKQNEVIVKLLIKNVIFAFLILIFLHFANVFDINLVLRFRYVVLIVLGFFTFLLFIFFERDKKENKRKFEPFLKILFLIGLALVFFASLDFEIFSNFKSTVLSIKTLNTVQNYIVAFTIISGFFTFYFNSERIEKEIKKEKSDEKKKEKERAKEFEKKFEKINKIPILRNIIKWMYKEGWWYSLGLGLAVLLGSFLRLWNLGKLSLWGDEGTVFIATKNIVETGLPYLETGLLYLRDLPHLYITAGFLHLFGYNEFALRLPTVLAGIFLVIVIYIIARKLFDKNLTLITTFIIALHPWIVEHSRIARSYSFVVFFLTLSFYFFLKMMENNQAKYVFLFTIFALITVFTHQTGNVVLFLAIPVMVHHLKNNRDYLNRKKLKNLVIKLSSFIFITIGIILSKIIFRQGYYTASEQQADRFASIQDSNIMDRLFALIPFGEANIESLLFLLNPIPIIGAFSLIFLAILFLKSSIGKFQNASLSLILITAVFFVAIIFSEKQVTINRAMLFLFPFVSLVFIFGIYYLKILLNMRAFKTILFLGFVSISMLFYNSTKITFADYGDPIYPYYSAFEGFIFRQDRKTTYEYINKHYEEGDIVLIYGGGNESAIYADFKPDYRVWSGTTLTHEGGSIFTSITEINNPRDIRSIILGNNRVWIITTYSIYSNTEKAPRVHHINSDLLKLLDKYSPNLVYQSKDSAARVYFIEN